MERRGIALFFLAQNLTFIKIYDIILIQDEERKKKL